jgi:hypothetical protein
MIGDVEQTEIESQITVFNGIWNQSLRIGG